MTDDEIAKKLQDTLADRFGERLPVDPALSGLPELAAMAGHRSYRRFLPRPLSRDALRLLCACALSAPSKSDLQQGDIVIVDDKAVQRRIADAIGDMPWIADAPAFLVFVANGRRVPAVAALRDKPFPNDHLDLFFNAVADAAIVLATFIRAAEAAGLGCCPISAIRDHAALVSDLLGLPDKVVPLAGLCVGWPAEQRDITPRLGLDTTVHVGRFDDSELAGKVAAYDGRREAYRPFARQRDPQRFGTAPVYGWSEDKARQYAEPLRADFGAFVRAKGFRLD